MKIPMETARLFNVTSVTEDVKTSMFTLQSTDDILFFTVTEEKPPVSEWIKSFHVVLEECHKRMKRKQFFNVVVNLTRVKGVDFSEKSSIDAFKILRELFVDVTVEEFNYVKSTIVICDNNPVVATVLRLSINMCLNSGVVHVPYKVCSNETEISNARKTLKF